MIKPISPGEVKTLKKTIIPDGVIEAFNEMIAKHYSGRTATFKQEDVMVLIISKLGIDRATIFENRWLDVEDIYRAEGWHVKYDKPAYCENYPATFTFEKK